MKEAYYTIKYNTRDDGFLIPNAVNVQFVLQTSTGTGTVPISMKFKTFFELSTATKQIYYRSGNPGYLDLRNLLVGTLDATTGGILVNKDGFRMPISTSSCLLIAAATNVLTTNADNVLRFNQNMSTSCYLESTLNDEPSFQTLCNAPALTTLAIISQLDSITRVGKFGNANVTYPSDWVTLTDQDLSYATSTYNTTSMACTLITEVKVQFLTSKVGFPDNQHAYIISARKKGISRTIYFDPYLSNQRIDIKVSFEYIRIIEDEASTSGYVLKPALTWPSDLFWPFATLDDSFHISTTIIYSVSAMYALSELLM
jgi:hypothetical protein